MPFSQVIPDSKVHVAHMGTTWVLLAPCEPHVGLMNLAIRDITVKLYGYEGLGISNDWQLHCLSYCLFRLTSKNSVRVQSRVSHFHSWKCIWKCCMDVNDGHLVQVLMFWKSTSTTICLQHHIFVTEIKAYIINPMDHSLKCFKTIWLKSAHLW